MLHKEPVGTGPFDVSQAPQARLAVGREIVLCLRGSDLLRSWLCAEAGRKTSGAWGGVWP